MLVTFEILVRFLCNACLLNITKMITFNARVIKREKHLLEFLTVDDFLHFFSGTRDLLYNFFFLMRKSFRHFEFRLACGLHYLSFIYKHFPYTKIFTITIFTLFYFVKSKVRNTFEKLLSFDAANLRFYVLVSCVSN